MLAIFLLSLATALLVINPYKKKQRLPPGSFPFPLLGNIPQIGWLVNKHGGIVGAMKATVHICSMYRAHETMIKRGNEFADRWNPSLFDEIIGQTLKYCDSKIHRRFTLHTLRNFGFGRAIIEDKIMSEYNLRMKEMEETMVDGRVVVDTQSFFELMVGSIINRLLFSESLEKNQEEEFFRLRSVMEETSDFSIIDFFAEYQWHRKLPFVSNRWQRMKEATDDVKYFIRRQIRDRIAAIENGTHVLDENAGDYIDTFLLKMEDGKESDEFNEKNLMAEART